jgi:hypothetical protein
VKTFLVLLFGFSALANEGSSGVDIVEFGARSSSGTPQGAQGAQAVAPSSKAIRNCFAALASGRVSAESSFQVIRARGVDWRVALVGAHDGKRGLFVIGRDKPVFFAAFPDSMGSGSGTSSGQVLLQLLSTDFVTSSPYVFLKDGKLGLFMNKLGVLRSGSGSGLGGSPSRAILLKPVRVNDSQSMAERQLSEIRELVPGTFERFKALGGTAKSSFLEALQLCREISEPSLRQRIDDEILKLTQR